MSKASKTVQGDSCKSDECCFWNNSKSCEDKIDPWVTYQCLDK